MASVDMEEMDQFPVVRDGREERGGRRKEAVGCCEKFQRTVSRWMLPENSRDTYLQRGNCCPPPIFIILISIAEQLAVFIYYAVWKPQKQWVTLDEGIWDSPLTYRADRRWEAWRFFSYMFVHAGVEHILGNLVMQLLLGIPLELVHKGFECVGGCVRGGLRSDWRILHERCGVGTDVGFAIYRRFLSDDTGLKVSFVAHIGGAVAGMSIGYVFFSAYNQKLLKDPRFWLCIAGYIIFLIAAVLFNVFLSPAP
ncbi:hypothetical protein CRUP_018912 [Coryphaenoides rupestris]|nr:hypothetical protein CRUP_018912 [Coryphaenoides rupestris]